MVEKNKKGSVIDRWAKEDPSQFKKEKLTDEELKEIEEMRRNLNKQFRDYVNK